MKKTFYSFCIVTLSLFFVFSYTGCTREKAFERASTKILENHQYGETVRFEDSNGDALFATATEDTIEFYITDDGFHFRITLNRGNDTFKWFAEEAYTMSGSHQASMITEETTSLPYDSTNVPIYLRTAFSEDCAQLLHVLLGRVNSVFSEVRATVSKLGFTEW